MVTRVEKAVRFRPYPDRGNGGITRYILLAVLPVFLFIAGARAGQYFVSPSGSDSSDGSESSPFLTLQHAVTVVVAGDTITLRDGVYYIGVTVRPTVSGTPGSEIVLRAYPGEIPILDFSLQTPSTSARGLYFSASYWYVRGITVRNAGDNGIYITGSHNTIENCTMYGNEDTGLQISGGGSYNYIYNCDSFGNYDSATHGENADGFAPKLTVGPGNVLRGCRAWDNADDGWDFYQAAYEIVIDSCWSFHNGYNLWGDVSFQGDGNGFKVGGAFVPAHQLVTRCVAFDNRSKGFDQNNNTAGVTIYNNTAWRNGGNNFSFPLTPSTGQHELVNNIAWGAINIEGTALQSSNSWQGYTVSAADFQNIDTSLARAPRNPDGSLPDVAFLHLVPGGQFVNAGEDVGLPYNGSAPDLGAFESDQVSAVSVQYVLRKGWNLLSLPVLAGDPRDSVLFPSAISRAQGYDSGYVPRDTLLHGYGYWINFASAETLNVEGGEIPADTVAVVAGWNMIGSISSDLPVSAIGGIPEGMTTGNFYGFAGAYVHADTLEPGRGYWVKTNMEGFLLLVSPGAGTVTSNQRISIDPDAVREAPEYFTPPGVRER